MSIVHNGDLLPRKSKHYELSAYYFECFIWHLDTYEIKTKNNLNEAQTLLMRAGNLYQSYGQIFKCMDSLFDIYIHAFNMSYDVAAVQVFSLEIFKVIEVDYNYFYQLDAIFDGSYSGHYFTYPVSLDCAKVYFKKWCKNEISDHNIIQCVFKDIT